MSDRQSALKQRFGEKKGVSKRGQKGRPKSDKDRKNISFWLDPEVIAELDKAYHQMSLDLAGTTSIDKATFRELVIRKGLSYVSDIRDDVRRKRD